MFASVTEFLKVFKIADGSDYSDFAYGDEVNVELVDCNAVNATYNTYENLVFPKLTEDDVNEMAHSNIDEAASYQEVVDWLTYFFNENADTEDNEFVSADVYSLGVSESGYKKLLSYVDETEATCLEDKSYDFGNDKTLAYGFQEAYNKRCEVGFTIIKPQGYYGKAHNWQLFVTGAYFVDASLADCGASYYHFNTPEVIKLVEKVNDIRRSYSNECDA